MTASPAHPAQSLLAAARRIAVLTGAGVSAESGVPTFRGADGLWKQFRAEELATPEAFARDPRLVWEWYGWRRELVARCAPNAAHRALARLALARPGDVTLITQNVDGLHALAAAEVAEGGDARAAMPLELHGAIFRVRCTRCDWRAEDRAPVDATSEATLPHCPRCGALARPDIVWFGEALDEWVLASAWGAAEAADVILVIGTSALVHPAASLPLVTLRNGGTVIEVNPQDTPITPQAAHAIRGPAAEMVPPLLEGLTPSR